MVLPRMALPPRPNRHRNRRAEFFCVCAVRPPPFSRPAVRQFDENLSANSPLRDNLEQACVDTVFGARGVELLNERSLAVMEETGVPVVPAHSLVEGQLWATPVSFCVSLS